MMQQLFENSGIALNGEQVAQFKQYAEFLVSENKKYNLTAITEIEAIYEKHFLDCALISPYLESVTSLADIGSGAGFPGVVLAILNPMKQITLIEPLKKRCHFLAQLINLLALKNVTIINARSEDCHHLRESFDVTTARAVANLPILLELCLPLTKVAGCFIAMKSTKAYQEIEASQNALKQLKSKVLRVDEHFLSGNECRLNVIVVKKEKTLAKYPRAYALIKKKPL